MFGIGNSLGTNINDFLGIFGVKGAGIGIGIDSLTGNQLGVLQNLHDHYMETAMGHGTGPIERRMAQFMGMPFGPFGMMPSPMAAYPGMMPYAGAGYGGMQQMDLAPGSTNIPILSKLFSPRRRMAGRFERILRTNPHARAAFEAQIGGRIVDFGFRNDGKFTVQHFAPGSYPGMAGAMNPMAASAMGYYGSMNHAAMGWGGGMGMGGMGMGGMGMGGMGGMGMGMPFFGAGSLFGSPFNGFALGGFSNVLGMQGPAGYGFSPWDNSGPMGGRGAGSWNPLAMPGRINNTNPMYESAHQAETAGVLADPSLTVEDKVTLLIMLIMKKMDKDIERQAQYINSIQQQQSNRGGKGGKGGGFMGIGGGKGGAAAGGGNNSPSIDVETMKLKRMVDKRSQMFDMLRQIIDKYNQTAKGIIDSIGR